jgi:hypothetical protein
MVSAEIKQHRSLKSWEMLCLVDLRKVKKSKIEKLVCNGPTSPRFDPSPATVTQEMLN